MNNLDLYNKWRSVPEEACKQFSNGNFSGTDINPMWRIKMLTEAFGPCGIGWYYEVVSERSEQHEDSTMAIVDLNLYIKVDGEWSKPIYGTGGNLLVRMTKKGPMTSDEGYKMALTDALSVACKALGIGADIYFANDKTKYTSQDTKPVEAAQYEKQDVQIKVNDTLCECCGFPIEGIRAGDKLISASEVIAKSRTKYGKALCYNCCKTMMKEAS